LNPLEILNQISALVVKLARFDRTGLSGRFDTDKDRIGSGNDHHLRQFPVIGRFQCVLNTPEGIRSG
jgi:hypothetical protein